MKNTTYFPNLNGLRFIAAFMVIIHHIESMKSTFKWQNINDNQTIFLLGKLGVILFFVLSGFLITYLLLNEEKLKGSINVKHFYLRRICRIWPLYFLIILLSLVVFPHFESLNFRTSDYMLFYDSIGAKIVLFIFFLPNLLLVRFGVMPYASQTWSIGVEEQFYLLWPWLIKWFKNKILMVVMVFVVYHILNFIVFNVSQIPYSQLLQGFFQFFNIDCMAIGAFFGIVLHQNRKKLLQVICNTYLFYFIAIIALSLIIKGYNFPLFNYQIYALLFGICIINLATMKATFLEHKWLNYLGKISYGLYMYHIIAIGITLVLLEKINLTSSLALYPISIAFTILLSAISYKYFETYFLKLKAKYQASN